MLRLRTAKPFLLTLVNMPLYTISAWLILSGVVGSVSSFVVLLPSNLVLQLATLQLTNGSRRTPLSICPRVTPAHKGLAA
jgi:hypothetical protein